MSSIPQVTCGGVDVTYVLWFPICNNSMRECGGEGNDEVVFEEVPALDCSWEEGEVEMVVVFNSGQW